MLLLGEEIQLTLWDCHTETLTEVFCFPCLFQFILYCAFNWLFYCDGFAAGGGACLYFGPQKAVFVQQQPWT